MYANHSHIIEQFINQAMHYNVDHKYNYLVYIRYNYYYIWIYRDLRLKTFINPRENFSVLLKWFLNQLQTWSRQIPVLMLGCFEKTQQTTYSIIYDSKYVIYCYFNYTATWQMWKESRRFCCFLMFLGETGETGETAAQKEWCFFHYLQKHLNI